MANWLKERVDYWFHNNFYVRNQMKKFKKGEMLSSEYLESWKQKEFLKLVKKAKSSSPFYREVYASIDLNGSFEEVYQRLPVLYKDQVRANAKRIATVPLRFLKKAHTSGTSGSPLEVYRSPISMMKESAYLWHHRATHGYHLGEPLISMRGNLDNKTMYKFSKAENTLFMSSYLLSKKNIHKYAELINDFKPKAILAFPSSVFSLTTLSEEAGLSVHIPLIYTSSETLYPFMRERVEKGLNGKMFDWYGNAERTIALGQCRCGNYHEPPYYGVFEYTDKGVITTSLINQSFPLIKYYVDDTFKQMTTPCECGRGIGVSAVEGRVDDVIILPDGTRVGRLGVAFQGIGHLRYAQIIQETIQEITVNMVVEKGFNQQDEDLLKSKLRQRLNESLKIELKQVEEKDIIKTAAGKFKLIVSKV